MPQTGKVMLGFCFGDAAPAGRPTARPKATPGAQVRSFIDQTRFIRVPDVSVLSRPEVEALFAAAVAQSKVKFRADGKPTLAIWSVSTKQRPRRKATALRE